MCRHAAWIGRPLPLSALTHDPPHALVVQSWKPRHMREATLNADGWGAAWYPEDGDPRPVRYRVATPAWSDENLEALAPRTRARCLVSTVRSATPGMPYGSASNGPYVKGRVTFAHNGYLSPFSHLRKPLRALLSDESESLVTGNTDSEHLFALLWQELRGDDSGESLVRAVRQVVRTAVPLALGKDGKAYLNFLVTNGEVLVATRFGTHGGGGSLFLAREAAGYEGGVVVASEPLSDDSAWLPVPDGVLIVAGHDGQVRNEPLE